MVQPANKRLVTEAALTAKGYVTAAEVDVIEGPEGPQGPQGPAGTNATITSASASGLAAGATPTVTLGGTSTARTFAFGIPAGAQGIQGVKGDTGNAGPTGADGAPGTPGTDATITGASASGLAAGATPTVTLGGTASARTFAFGIPAGAAGTNGTNGTNGTSADITGVSASGLAAGASPTATLGGTALARTIAFGIPAGAAGAQGVKGDTGDAGPAGADGAPGTPGIDGISTSIDLNVVGRYVNAQMTSTALGTTAATADRMYLVPIISSRTRNIDQLSSQVTTLLAGNVRYGIYNSVSSTGFPGTVYIDGGTPVSTSTTGAKPQTVSGTITKGVMYWLAITCTSAATFNSISANEMRPITGGASAANAGNNHCYVTHSANNALPDLTSVTPTFAGATIPAVSYRIAA